MSIITKQQSVHQMSSQRRSRGFSLLEALIGFMILSIGMLGIASLQAVSLKAGKTSVYNSVAMMKVEELFESMRANPSALASYAGSSNNSNCASNACTPALLAQEDLYWWEKNLKAGLPGSATTNVIVTLATAPSNKAVVQIDVNWSERDKNSTGSVSKSYTTTANICTANPC